MKTTSCRGGVDGDGEAVFEAGRDVVGVEDGHVADGAEAFGAKLTDVRVGADHHAEVAVEGADAADTVGAIVDDDVLVALKLDDRRRLERGQDALERDRAGAGPATAVRRREGLVQVELHDVDAGVPRARAAEHGIQVGAVPVDEAAARVHERGNLGHGLFVETERVGVGHHQRRDVVRSRVEGAGQGFELDDAARPRRERTASKPLSAQLAGFVPWALSGMKTLRGERPCAR